MIWASMRDGVTRVDDKRPVEMGPKAYLKRGHYYSARVHLTGLDSYGNAGDVAEKFRELGFVDVVVDDDGNDHFSALGKWNCDTMPMPTLPESVSQVMEVE
jgi:hypothetical protein